MHAHKQWGSGVLLAQKDCTAAKYKVHLSWRATLPQQTSIHIHHSHSQSVQPLMLDDISLVWYCCQQHVRLSVWTVERITKGDRRELYSHSLNRWLCKGGMTFFPSCLEASLRVNWHDGAHGGAWLVAGKFNRDSFQIYCTHVVNTCHHLLKSAKDTKPTHGASRTHWGSLGKN